MTSEVQERASVEPAPGGEEAIRRARKRAEAVQGLYTHVLVYLVINAGLFVINLITRGDEGSWWFFWPLAIWGTALLVHAVTTYVPVFSPEWAERRAQQMVEEGRAP